MCQKVSTVNVYCVVILLLVFNVSPHPTSKMQTKKRQVPDISEFTLYLVFVDCLTE